MKYNMVFIFFLSLFFFNIENILIAAEREEIRLLEKVVQKSIAVPLTLADLLPETPEAERLVPIFKNYPLFFKKKPMRKNRISNEQISNLIRQVQIDRKILINEYNFVLPSEVELQTQKEADSSSPKDMGGQEKYWSEALLKEWKTQCSDCRFEIQELNVPSFFSLNSLNTKTARESWRFISQPSLPRGSFSVGVEIKQKTKTEKWEKKNYWINGVARILRQVPVLTRQLSFGETIGADDIKIEYRDTTFSQDKTADDRHVIGRRLRLTKAANQILWPADLLREKAVLRGDWVRLIVHEGAMEVTVMAKAESEGFIGEEIRIRVGANKSLLTGVAQAKGEVTLQ